MRRLLALLVAAVVALTAVPAAAELVIRSSQGGRIGDYLELYETVRQSGRRVIIDGPCMSACTLVVSVVPRERICVTSRAVLGFHAAWRPDIDGRPLRHPEATRLMMDTYPPAIRNWIRRRGGLTSRTLLLQGRTLASMYPRCGQPERRAGTRRANARRANTRRTTTRATNTRRAAAQRANTRRVNTRRAGGTARTR